MENMSRQQAAQIRAAVEHLQGKGSLTPDQQKALDRGLALLGEAEKTQASYDARYRGAMRGATIGFSDEMAGAASALTGGSFAEGKQRSIEKDQAASVLDPEGFATGQNAGAIGTATIGAGSLPALKGANWATKIGVPGVIGGLFGGGQGYSDYELAGKPEGELWDYLKGPAAAGVATGMAIYPMGRIAGALTGKTANAVREGVEGFGRLPTRTMARAVQNTQDSGQDIQRYLDGLTGEAVLADVPGDLQTRAQGLAALGGPGGQQVRRTVNERAEGAGERIAAELDARVAGPNAEFNERRRLAAERANKLGPEYEAALSAPGPIPVDDVIAELEGVMAKAGPDTAPVLRRFVDDLTAKGGEAKQIDAASLHWIRSDLSDAIDGTPSKRNALLQSALKRIDAELDNVPGYADARSGYASNRAMERAIDEGEGALRGGRVSALSPAELEEKFNKLSAAEKDGFRVGVRRDVAALMGTSRNDAASAWGEFAKNWNEEKLRIVLGADAEPIIKRLRSEQVFSQTRGRVDAGSKTAETQAARDDLADYADAESGRRPGPVERTKRAVGDATNKIVDSILYGPRRESANADLGRMLTMQGPERDRLIAALLQDAQQSNAAKLSPAIAERLARALAAGGVAAQTGN